MAQLDFSKAQPIGAPPPPPQPDAAPSSSGAQLDFSKAVTLDFSKAQPTTAEPAKPEGVYQMTTPDRKSVVGIPYSKNDDALNAGYTFVNDDERKRFTKDYAHDPRVIGAATKFAVENADPVLSMGAGVAKGALQTATGAGHLVGAHSKVLDELASADSTNAYETLGSTAESIAEFLMGDEALKGLSYADRLKKTATVMKAMEKSPILTRAITTAMRQGVVSGGQTFVKTGGNLGESVASGLTAGALGVIPAAAIEGGSALVRRVQRPMLEKAALQEETDKSILDAARKTAARTLEEVNESRATPPINPARTLTSSTGPYEFRLQGTPTVATTEGDAVMRAAPLPRANMRVPEGGTPSAENAKELGSTADTVPNSMLKRDVAYMHSEAPGETPETTTIGGGGELRTQDPQVVKQHIANLNEAIDSPEFSRLPPEQRQHLLDSRRSAQMQMKEYHDSVLEQTAHNVPNFDPVDIRDAIQHTGSFPEAVDHINQAHKEVYQRLDDVTGGDFKAIQNAGSAAWNKYINAEGIEAKNAAGLDMAKAEDSLKRMFANLRGIVSPKELEGANQAYKNGLMVEKVSNVVERSLEGTYRDNSRAINGRVLLNGLKSLYESSGSGTQGRAAVERVIGADTLENLENIARKNFTGEGQDKTNEILRKMIGYAAGAAFGGAAHGIAHAPYGFTLGGAYGVYHGTEFLLHKMATNPRWGNFVIHAAENTNRVLPKTLIPILSGVLADSFASDEQWRKQQQKNSTTMAVSNPRGLVEPGNLDIWNRPTVQNANGSHSSEFSVSVGDDQGHEVLLPTIVNGRFLTPDGKIPKDQRRDSPEMKALTAEAWKHYEETGEHLGKFDNADDADAYAGILHNRGERKP